MKKGLALSVGHRVKRSVLRTLIAGAVSLLVLAPASVAKADPTLAEIEAQLDKSGDELELTVEAWNKINGDLAATQASAAELQKKMQPLVDNVNATNAYVDVFAVAQFKSSGSMASLSVLLNAGNSDTLVDQLTMLHQVNQYHQHQISDYNQAKSKLDEEKKKLDETLAAQNAQKADLEAKKVKIEADVKKLDDLKRQATAAGSKKTAPATKPTGPPPAVSGRAGQAVTFAWNQIGKPYKWGSAGPNTWDCSGLTMGSWNAAGVSLPHNAAQQWSKVAHISRADLAPGDLVFYNGLGHVGIYIGNNQIIHAPTTGRNVEIASVDRSKPYGYGRVKT